MNSKNYIISQRLKYLTLGVLVGYFMARNEAPLRYYLLGFFVLFGIILTLYFSKKGS